MWIYLFLCFTYSNMYKEDTFDRRHLKRGSIDMKFSMTIQEKCDCPTEVINMTAQQRWSHDCPTEVITWAGLTVFSTCLLYLKCYLLSPKMQKKISTVNKLTRTKFISISQWFTTLSLTTVYTGKGMGDRHIIIMFINKYTVKQERNIYW
jgi:hypothetical protein